jgi:hypothetical protein
VAWWAAVGKSSSPTSLISEFLEVLDEDIDMDLSV